LCPALFTTVKIDFGTASCKSLAALIGQTISYCPWEIYNGISLILSILFKI